MIHSLPGRVLGLFFSRLIPSVSILVVGMIFSRVIPAADYGVYTALWVQLSVASVIAAWGFPGLVLSYGSRMPDHGFRRWKRRSALVAFSLASGSALVFGVVLDYPVAISVLGATLVLVQAWFVVQEAETVRLKLEWQLQAVNAVWALGFLAVHLLVWQTGYSLEHVLLGWLMVSAARLIAVSVVLQSRSGSPELPGELPSIGGIWLGFGLSDALQILSRWLDKLVVGVLVTASEFAVYFNGTFEIPVIAMLMTSMAAVVTSKMSETIRDGGQNPFYFFRLTTRFTAGLVFPLFFLAFWQRDLFITTLFSDGYAESAALFGIYCWVLPIRIGAFSSLLQVSGDSRRLVTGAVLDLVLSVSLMGALYPVAGLKGIILAVVLSTWVQAAYYLVSASRQSGILLTGIMDWKHLSVRFVVSGAGIGFLSLLTVQDLPLGNSIPALVGAVALAGFFVRADWISLFNRQPGST